MNKKNYLAIFAKSFNWAGFFLPKKIYEDSAKLYAFCRVLDDIADEKTELDSKIKSIKKSKNYSINKNLLVDISKVKNKYLNFIKRTSIDKPNFIFRFYNIVKFIFNLYLVKITNWLI